MEGRRDSEGKKSSHAFFTFPYGRSPGCHQSWREHLSWYLTYNRVLCCENRILWERKGKTSTGYCVSIKRGEYRVSPVHLFDSNRWFAGIKTARKGWMSSSSRLLQNQKAPKVAWYSELLGYENLYPDNFKCRLEKKKKKRHHDYPYPAHHFFSNHIQMAMLKNKLFIIMLFKLHYYFVSSLLIFQDSCAWGFFISVFYGKQNP